MAGGGSVKKSGNGASASKGTQKTLFSFFSKKAPTAPSPAVAPASASASTTTSGTTAKRSSPASISPPSTEKGNTAIGSNNKSAAAAAASTNSLWKQVQVGDEISVYWPDDDQYYDATVEQQKGTTSSSFYIRYDDGEQEWVDLSTETFQLLDTSKPKSKRRKIDSDDDGEAEFEDDEDEELYEDDGVDEEDDDQWMVTDDEDEEKPKAKKNKPKKLKKLKVTPHPGNSNSRPGSAFAAKKSSSTSASSSSSPVSATYKTPLKQFANNGAVTPANNNLNKMASSSTTPASAMSKMSTATVATTARTPSSVLSKQGTTNGGDKIPMYIKEDKNGKKVVNVKGSHLHNHLKFLLNPRDSQGRTKDHPDYDPRTLKIDYRELEKHDKKLTDAKKQWWELKSQYFDTVLLFKVGKFYEMFHMDADVVSNYLYT